MHYNYLNCNYNDKSIKYFETVCKSDDYYNNLAERKLEAAIYWAKQAGYSDDQDAREGERIEDYVGYIAPVDKQYQEWKDINEDFVTQVFLDGWVIFTFNGPKEFDEEINDDVYTVSDKPNGAVLIEGATRIVNDMWWAPDSIHSGFVRCKATFNFDQSHPMESFGFQF